MSIFNRTRRYKTPSGDVYTLFNDMAAQHNLLIAGQVGSGKSCVMNSIVYNLLFNSPGGVKFVFIDPKWTEFRDYENLPHTLRYACSDSEIVESLRYVVGIMDQRKADMQKRRIRNWDGSVVFVLIDELAQIMLTMKKTAKPLLQQILQTGRALGIRLIAGTQCPLATVIPTELRVNFTGIVGLRTATAQHSRNILGVNGCELLPDPKFVGYCQGYFQHGGSTELWNIPRYTDDQHDAMIRWWTSRQCVA